MTNKPYTLLVALDFSELSDRALHEAFAQASQRASSEVHVLTALPMVGDLLSVYGTLDEKSFLGEVLQKLRTHTDTELDKFRLEQPAASVSFPVISHAIVDAPAHAIVQLASNLAADLIVIGTSNRKGLERLLLGSVAEGTVRNAHCPVLVIPAPPEPEPEIKLDPPCAECVQVRTASAGKELWCEQHRERHGRRHTYHQSDRSGADSNFPLVFR